MSRLEIHVGPDGIPRPLGHLASPGSVRLHAPPLAVLPESEWREFDLTAQPHPIRIKDQNGYGACNGHAAASSLEWARWIAGETHEDLSAWYVYAILCNGIDRGSMISDALELLRDRGTCPDGSVPHGTINPRRLSSEAHAQAPRFRIEIGAELRSFDEMMTATQLAQPFNYSIRVGGGFDNLDSDGVCGFSRGVGNHAVTGGLGAKKTAKHGWVILWQNSWGQRWGRSGYAWVSRRHVEEQGYFSAYLVRAVRFDPQDPHPAPIVATA
jgi:hypothetical protein